MIHDLHLYAIGAIVGGLIAGYLILVGELRHV